MFIAMRQFCRLREDERPAVRSRLAVRPAGYAWYRTHRTASVAVRFAPGVSV